MAQRSAQLEIDLDQTAASLCEEMSHAADRKACMSQLQERYMFEQEHRQLAEAAASGE